MKIASTHLPLLLTLLLGLVAGLVLERFLSARAEAQPPTQGTQCAAVTLWGQDGAAFANPNWRPQTISIPSPWRVVGGAGVGDRAYAVICR